MYMCVCTENFINLIVCDILVCKNVCMDVNVCAHMDNELAELLVEVYMLIPICGRRRVLEWYFSLYSWRKGST